MCHLGFCLQIQKRNMARLPGSDWQTFADRKLNQIFKYNACCPNAETQHFGTSGFEQAYE
jgi:hypothetical protein